MTKSVVTGDAPRRPWGESALNAATTLWFVVLVLGQALFLYFIFAFYGSGFVSGDFEAWNRHPMISDPYVSGDVFGNVAFASHIVLAAIITLGGAVQLIPWVRARAIGVHRWNGRVFMLAASAASLSGLYIVWGRHGDSGDIFSKASISLNAVLILLFVWLAWRAAATRNIGAHRRWALRAFMVTNGVFFLRFGFGGWIVITQAEPSALTFHVFAFLSYLLPLALTELYLRAKAAGEVARVSMAGVVLGAAGYLAIGFFGFYFVFMRAILGAVAT